MNLGLKNKNVIVTGGSHGIGLATALMFASEGCNIIICARDKDKLEYAKSKIELYDVECITIQVDVLDKVEMEQSFKKILECWDKIHVLVNNVGGGGRWGINDFEKNPDDVWKEVYDKNVTASIFYTRFVLPIMKKQRWGRIVTVTSTLGRQAGGRPWFNMAKTAQTCLMKNLSLNKELVRHNITFNSVAPGCIMIPDTGWDKAQKNEPDNFKKMLDNDFPMGRMGSPEEVAFGIVMLCAEQSSLINGASLTCDGGETVCF